MSRSEVRWVPIAMRSSVGRVSSRIIILCCAMTSLELLAQLAIPVVGVVGCVGWRRRNTNREVGVGLIGSQALPKGASEKYFMVGLAGGTKRTNVWICD